MADLMLQGSRSTGERTHINCKEMKAIYYAILAYKVIHKVEVTDCMIFLIAPIWPSRAYFPTLLRKNLSRYLAVKLCYDNPPAAVVYARQGSNATLSWRLPQPAVREFTVRRYSSDITLFHVTNYNKVDITSTYRTRAEFTGNIDSSGSGVFSFLLYDVVWNSDRGVYSCYRGSPGSRGDQMSDCGQVLDVIRCGEDYTDPSGSISSPNYPGNYGNYLICVYTIDAGETLVTLVFTNFSTEHWHDVVKVYDVSNNLLATLSGDRHGYIVQSAVYYRVVFTTNPWTVGKGFRAVWTVAKDSSARFGGYATLSWIIPDPGTSEFSVCNSETKRCLLHITGYNDVRAASDKFTSRVRFIGNVSSSGTGLFRFVLSDVTWEDEGHYKCYIGSPDSGGQIITGCGQKLVMIGCGEGYTNSSGSISSPNYPGNYGNYLNCVYTIDAGETLVTLVFTNFSTQEGNDVVKVYDASSNLLASLSGDRHGYIVQSAVFYRVVFTTDPWNVRKGFRAVWTVAQVSSARFGGYATLSWILPDPGTSGFSVCNSETKRCLLHITGYNDVRAASDKFTSRVRFIGNVSSSGTGLFRFVLSDVTWEDEGHYKCYIGSPDSGGQIITGCGQKLVMIGGVKHNLRTNIITYSLLAIAITLLVSTSGCGEGYTDPSGSISSPNYPGNYGNYLNCVYTIDAGETLVTLVFTNFSTEEGYDVVKVYDASNSLLATLSGDRQGYIVQSAVYYRVVFTTNPWNVGKGFRAVWTVTTTEYARFGGYATLSWTLPEPGTREFSVCNSETKKCLLHITDYNDVKFTSRVRFIGNVSSSGTGLFRFVLSDVTVDEEGQYICHRGSSDSAGPIIPNCGQKLLVLNDAMIGETVTLSCRLPQPAVREFTVWNSNWSIPLAHVTNFKDANIVSEVYRSRLTLRFHGKDLLILELKYVVLNDEGQFRCHSGTPDSIGSRIAGCGQQLNVYGKYLPSNTVLHIFLLHCKDPDMY
ncbi:deleted in malignant brain tumors 1 protein-like [Haliotis rufescens]|uniref:deleted in malignant brain tumors 1 protein-like n=1 Tax=Haliotis rufescens TaxID=6454 RepID=UPI00201F69D8|nr:deleted in malignant brain tumors 1 protein-like [Haliotis rufescens]